MAHRKGSKSRQNSSACTPPVPTKYKDRNLAATNPNKEQFEPTDAAPIPQHVRMAGGG